MFTICLWFVASALQELLVKVCRNFFFTYSWISLSNETLWLYLILQNPAHCDIIGWLISWCWLECSLEVRCFVLVVGQLVVSLPSNTDKCLFSDMLCLLPYSISMSSSQQNSWLIHQTEPEWEASFHLFVNENEMHLMRSPSGLCVFRYPFASNWHTSNTMPRAILCLGKPPACELILLAFGWTLGYLHDNLPRVCSFWWRAVHFFLKQIMYTHSWQCEDWKRLTAHFISFVKRCEYLAYDMYLFNLVETSDTSASELFILFNLFWRFVQHLACVLLHFRLVWFRYAGCEHNLAKTGSGCCYQSCIWDWKQLWSRFWVLGCWYGGCVSPGISHDPPCCSYSSHSISPSSTPWHDACHRGACGISPPFPHRALGKGNSVNIHAL